MLGKLSLSATLLIAVLASLALRSAAAQVIPLTGRQLAAGSPDVVVAVVAEARSRWNSEHTLIVTDYQLRIEDRLKGDAPERVLLTVPGGVVGRETHGTSVSTPLAIGARYLLFLSDRERPTLVPITGGWQGVFRETAGPEGKRGFDELVRAARNLIAAVEQSSEPADTAWLTRTENPDLPAKIYERPTSPASAATLPVQAKEAKFLVRNAALAPIVFNTLLPGTPFSSQDQEQMAYWNLYAGDLFRISPNPSANWAFGNGVFDIAGFPSSEQVQQQFNLAWSPGAYALTAWRIQDGHIIEADLAFNPAFEWTVDDEQATRIGGPLSFKDALLSNLGEAWGYRGLIELLDCIFDIDSCPVARDSIMNLKAPPYRLATLFAEDVAAARATYGGPPIRDGIISSYNISSAPLTPDYVPVRPLVASAAAGASFVLLNSVKIENAGTVGLANLSVEVYLAPQRFSLDGAILLRKVRIGGTIPPGEVRNLSFGRIKLPRSVRAGTYYFAFVLRDPKDDRQANNRAWSNDDVKLVVR